MKAAVFFAAAAFAFCACAERTVIDGVEYECVDGICMPAGAALPDGLPPPAAGETPSAGNDATASAPRIAQGYMDADAFIAFLDGRRPAGGDTEEGLASMPVWLMLLAVLFGGFCLNLTPCVLPMMPVTLMVIGRSPSRGLMYALGLALAYGTLGVAASAFGLSFGAIQGNPWFNAAVAAVFAVFALAMSGAFFIDFSGRKNTLASSLGGKTAPGVFAFLMGVAGAVLAGACVAPVLLAVLAHSAVLSSSGDKVLAVALPFVLGAGMALPWPFAAAGLKVLPKPGAWMKHVNRVFAAIVFAFAVWYGRLAWIGFAADGALQRGSSRSGRLVEFGSPAEFSLEGLERPVLVDCWASWCKNCAAMEAKTFADPAVKKKLENWTVVRLRAENIPELLKLPGFEKIVGLPAFVVFP